MIESANVTTNSRPETPYPHSALLAIYEFYHAALAASKISTITRYVCIATKQS
jgi:hypothetical protein